VFLNAKLTQNFENWSNLRGGQERILLEPSIGVHANLRRDVKGVLGDNVPNGLEVGGGGGVHGERDVAARCGALKIDSRNESLAPGAPLRNFVCLFASESFFKQHHHVIFC
jgi:hypothetical protein